MQVIPEELLNEMKGQEVTTTWAYSGMRWKLMGFVDRQNQRGTVTEYKPGRMAKIVRPYNGKVNFTEVSTLRAVGPLPKKKDRPKPDPLEEVEKTPTRKELVLDGKMQVDVNWLPLPPELANHPFTMLDEILEEIEERKASRAKRVLPVSLEDKVQECVHGFPINHGCPDCKEDIPLDKIKQGYVKDRWGNIRHPVMIRRFDRLLKEDLSYLCFDLFREALEHYSMLEGEVGEKAREVLKQMRKYWTEMKP